MENYYIGIDIGGTKVAYGLFDERRKLLKKYQHPSDTEAPAARFCDTVANKIREIFDENGLPLSSLGGVGVAMPSFILFDKGIVVKTANLPHFKNFPVRDYFEAALETRVILDNDGNTAALAEHRYGAGRGFEHIIYCPISTGISSGIIINGKLFRGTYGWAGETGHMIADIGGGSVPCQCGNSGCFESHISGSKIVRHVAQKIQAGEKSVISELCGGNLDKITAKDIQAAYELGDQLALWALEHMSKYLGVWLFNLYQAFNINCFVFGGGLVNFGEALFGRVRAVFDEYNNNDLPVYMKTAELGSDFGIIGAVELLFDSLC